MQGGLSVFPIASPQCIHSGYCSLFSTVFDTCLFPTYMQHLLLLDVSFCFCVRWDVCLTVVIIYPVTNFSFLISSNVFCFLKCSLSFSSLLLRLLVSSPIGAIWLHFNPIKILQQILTSQKHWSVSHDVHDSLKSICYAMLAIKCLSILLKY